VTTPLWCLVIVAFLPYPLSFLGGYFRARQFGRVDNKHPRQQQALLEGPGARVLGAQANAWEALGVFTAAVVVLHLANPDAARSSTAANVSIAFVAARIVHAICYVANLDILRSLVFFVGIVCAVWLIVLA